MAMYKRIIEIREAIQKQKVLQKIMNTADGDQDIIKYVQREWDNAEEELSDLYDDVLTGLGLDALEDRDKLEEYIKL